MNMELQGHVGGIFLSALPATPFQDGFILNMAYIRRHLVSQDV
jgi:uncharacterized membrane protein YbaN (DUF454 family)